MATTTTRLQLFMDLADELGDLVDLTADGAGASDTFVATGDMIYADGALGGREVWYATAGVSSAANAGTRRLCLGNDLDTGAITVAPAWPAAPIAGDRVLLVNSRGTGVTIPEMHRKINQLIRRIGRGLADEVAADPVTFDMTDPILTIPSTWDGLLGIQIERSSSATGVWDALIGKPYTVNPWDTPRTVTIAATHRGLCHDKRLRLIGVIDLQPLDEDSDTTTAPASWIAKTGAYELLEAVAVRSGDVATALTLGELLKAQALDLRAYVGKRYSLGPRIDLAQ